MARKVGVVRVNFEAGTAEFEAGVQKVTTSVRNFNTNVQGSTRTSTAAIKTLGGAFPIRAAAQFANEVLKLGPILQAAFPVVGALAFGSVLVKLGGDVQDFFKELRAAPEKSAAGWNTLNASIRSASDELELANARLDNEIAKLDGKRQNNLVVALTEAKVAADHLGESLETDITKTSKLLTELKQTFLQNLFSGGFFGKQDNTVVEALQRVLGGESGVGGLYAKIQQLTEAKNQALDGLAKRGTTTTTLGVTVKLNEEQVKQQARGIRDFYDKQLLDSYQHLVSGIDQIFKDQDSVTPRFELTNRDRETLTNYRRVAAAEIKRIQDSAANEDKTDEKNDKEIAKANAKLTEPIRNKIAELQAQLKGINDLSNAIGGTEAQQVAAKANAEYEKTLTELNKALEDHQNLLGAVDKAKIKGLLTSIAQGEADKATKQKFDEENKAIQERIKGYQELAKAVGQSYESSKSSFVETETAKTTKEHANDPDWLKKWDAKVQELRTALGKEFDAVQSVQAAKTIDALDKQIELEKALAAVQSQGAEAVRKKELDLRIQDARKVAPPDKRDEIERKIREEDADARANQSGKNIDALKQETEAYQKLSAAAASGAEAIRKQALENKYAQLKRNGAPQAEIDAAKENDEAKHQEEINLEVSKRNNLYADQLEQIRQLQAAGDNTLATERLKLRLLSEQVLLEGNAKAGVRAFFLEVQAQARTTAEVVRDTLSHAYQSALDGISDQFARFITGQKTSFAELLKSLGGELAKDGIKAGIEKGLGALAKIFNKNKTTPQQKRDGQSENTAIFTQVVGDKSGDKSKTNDTGKPDGTSSNPFYVIVEGSMVGNSSQGSSTGRTLQEIGGLITAGAAAGAGLNGAITARKGLASGGDVNPGETYVVGERGPELFTSRTPGTIVPNHTAFGGGGNTYYTIDARGSQLGVENRIAKSIEMAHQSAISNSVRANHERSLRTPVRKS